jgi:BMFP domain-containing protein YqiC
MMMVSLIAISPFAQQVRVDGRFGSWGGAANGCTGQCGGGGLHRWANAIADNGIIVSQSNNRIFDGLGRIMNEAAGVADGVRREVETVAKSQAQRIVADMELVKREDFDALRELVQVQGEEIDALRQEIAALKAAKTV